MSANHQHVFQSMIHTQRSLFVAHYDDLEGGCKTTGYVPASSVSKSGVTIATGFDLGQRNENDLRSLKLNSIIVTKLKPYLGLKGVS